jgi:hypothetical protein
MLPTCPKCGLQTDVVEGKSTTETLCEHCGQPITSSMQFNDQFFPIPKRRKIAWLIVIFLVALIGLDLIGILIGYVLPSIEASREAGRRATCISHQKQISLALLSYESENGHYPPAYIADKNGNPMHSWRVLILPYLDRNDLYEQYDFSEPWNGPHNRLLADKMPGTFGCPSDPSAPNCTAFTILVGPHAFSPGPTGRSNNDFSRADGTSTTLMLVEATEAKINWLEPRDLNVEEMSFIINKDAKEISSHHPGRACATFCDGHQTVLTADIKPETLKALTTFDGHEPVNDGEF